MRSRYKFNESEGMYFVTSTIVEWIPIFTSLPYFNIIIDSLNYCITHKNLLLFAYVIMDNHLHLIVQGENIDKTLQSFKMYTATQIIKQLEIDNKHWLLNELKFNKLKHKSKSTFQVWQESSHPQQIDHYDMMVQKLEYIHNNPVKRGFVEQPEHWCFSSARNYILNMNDIIKIELLDLYYT